MQKLANIIISIKFFTADILQTDQPKQKIKCSPKNAHKLSLIAPIYMTLKYLIFILYFIYLYMYIVYSYMTE